MFSAFYKIHKTSTNKFNAHTMSDSKGIRSKSRFIIRSKFLIAQFFPFTGILLKLQQQILTYFCKFIWYSEIRLRLLTW